ncbi:hypothetical protein [Mycolicibacterium sp. CBMA 226]|uniref:hypothetical protein n=1 Tax=Mycolicibacterium sp. CBMA 226 TaxID=2606611 RepID=UPI0014121DF8|nr:hypothetical protein [Mycolicibacterium sp. CBMA 226]
MVDIVESMLGSLSADHPFGEGIGPFYDSDGAAECMRRPRRTVETWACSHQLLACPTAEGPLVFPAFQFNLDGTPLPGLEPVLFALARGAADRWRVALWMSTLNTSSITAPCAISQTNST